MDPINLNLSGDGKYRPTEVLSDLRIVAETMYGPMKMVGFWDFEKDIHLCPHIEKRKECPHKLEESDPNYVAYETTLMRERQATLSIAFPHAKTTLFLS